jgi:prophage tail gpP-like protein
MSDIQTITIVGRRPPSDDVSIVVDGRHLAGWTEVRITRGIERCPSDFQLGMTELYPGQADAMQIKPGQACVVKIGRDVVITGYVDRVIPRISARQHSITVVGRGKCQDLIDCSAEWPGGQISGASVLEIARKLAKPYDIDVTAATDPGDAIPQFNLMRGETPFEIIERLCRFRQLLAYDTPDGNLLLSQVANTRAANGFQEGVNVQDAWATWSMEQRFSTYRAYLQSVETLADLGQGGDLLGEYEDKGVPRHRLRIIVAESSGGGLGLDVARDRAQWEASRRWGRSAEVRITTDTWRDAKGALYTPNTLAPVDLPSLKITRKLWAISEVTFKKDGNTGTTCDLVLMPPEAFLPQPFLLQPVPAELALLPQNLGRP